MSNIFFKFSNSSSSFLRPISDHLSKYPTPINLNYSYSFGSLAGLYFFLQVITGVLLAMHYVSHTKYAFDSVVYIMQEVNFGWLMRYMHMNGASMIFIFLYCHIGRSIYYKSYLHKRITLWYSGILIFLLMMATAFIGYVLPWGQMSLWGATVITNFVTAVPYIGEKIVHWIWGGFSVGNATLTRFYSLHYLLPFLIFALIFSHLILLHQVGSTHPGQTSTNSIVPFHPYFTYKDAFAFNLSLMLFVLLVFFYPNLLGHPDNYIKANPLMTPAHIVPEWYFTPFYAILRTCSSKLGGVISMLLAILILFLLPLQGYAENPVQNTTDNSKYHKTCFWIFAATFVLLIYLGGKPAIAPYITLSRIYTAIYFIYMLLLIGNVIGIIENLFAKKKTKICA